MFKNSVSLFRISENNQVLQNLRQAHGLGLINPSPQFPNAQVSRILGCLPIEMLTPMMRDLEPLFPHFTQFQGICQLHHRTPQIGLNEHARIVALNSTLHHLQHPRYPPFCKTDAVFELRMSRKLLTQGLIDKTKQTLPKIGCRRSL